MAMIARENSSLRRRSGVRKAAANACSTCPPLVGRMRLAIEGPRPPHPSHARGEPPDGAGGEPRDGAEGEGVGVLRPLDRGGAASGRTDLLGGGRRKGVRGDV